MTPDEELLLEQVVSAFRHRNADGEVTASPAWHDLSDEARREAFVQTSRQRALESALDPKGHSTTIAAVLARIRNA